jgi:hypothetical protein
MGRDAAAGNHQGRPKAKINRIAQGRPDGGIRRYNSIVFFTPRISPVCTDRKLVTNLSREETLANEFAICYLLSVICYFIRASGSNDARLVAVSNGRVEREKRFLSPASKKQLEWRQRHQLHRRQSDRQAARQGGSQIARNSTN